MWEAQYEYDDSVGCAHFLTGNPAEAKQSALRYCHLAALDVANFREVLRNDLPLANNLAPDGVPAKKTYPKGS